RSRDVEENKSCVSGRNVTSISLIVNFVSSILIILLNKSLFVNYGLPPLFVACFQFFSTFVGLFGIYLIGYLQIKRVPILKVFPLCVAFCSFVVFTNLSLKHNTVGTYQLLKCLSDPVTFTIQAVFYGKRFSTQTKVALAMVVGGVLVNYTSDVKFNWLGAMFGLTAVVASSLYYTWIETKQEELDLSAPQLLIYQSSVSSAMLACFVISLELHDLQQLQRTFKASDLHIFLATGILAFAVSTSVFYIINKTSVVTYAVFCKLKICVIIIGGYVMFREEMTSGQTLGIIVTLLGTAMYAMFNIREGETSNRSSGNLK
uniref:Sugar phosphate transporter domain-containing protein n=1 Tax=Ciona savignyi TaxID=51511 RepID=H2Y9Q0_CIOSA